MQKTMTALIIMDGFGINPAHEGNAIYQQGTPRLDALMDRYPHTKLGASGMDVGLPDGQMGNSEVGHLNIGAGRIVYQELTRITKDIQDGTFFEKAPLIHGMDTAKETGKSVHLMGLVSDGGVHSHITHLYALLEMCKRRCVEKVYVHCFLDGRDVPPTSGIDYVRELQAKMDEIGVGKIATVMGRYWAMDRDNLWDRVQKAYDAMVLGQGQATAETAVQAVEQSYAKEETDEFVKPTVVLENGQPVATIGEGDSVIFFNFRPDRARQLTRTFIQPDFNGFPRGKGYFHVNFVSMTQYDETFTGLEVVNPPETLKNTLGEMSAYEITDKAIELINEKKYDVMILNFANCDMVGHTGVMEAAMKAVAAVDECVDRVVKAVLDNGGRAFVTADHGNADQMVDPETGEPFTAHTTNPVPFIAIGPEMVGKKLREGGRLADIAPTMLDSMGIPVPAEMTGKSLIVK